MCCILSDEESWNDVIIACSPLAAKWKQLSGFMGLSFKTIYAIKDNNDDNEASWNEALMKWILQDYNTEKHGLPSWKSLLQTVSRVDQPLFEKLAREHQAKGGYTATHNVNQHTTYRIAFRCTEANSVCCLYYCTDDGNCIAAKTFVLSNFHFGEQKFVSNVST